jgi:hypothetical protein
MRAEANKLAHTHDEGRRYLAGLQDSSDNDGRRCDDDNRMSMADVERRISCQNTQSLFREVEAKDGDAKTGAVAGRPGEGEEHSETVGAQGRRKRGMLTPGSKEVPGMACWMVDGGWWMEDARYQRLERAMELT